MSNLQGALRILAGDIEYPGPLVTRLNQWLCRNIPVTKFITLVCLQLEANGSRGTHMAYANAGHCPPILIRADATVMQLAATGTVLGVHEDFTYGEQQLVIHPGDSLLLYTDGITEAENANGEMFGEERLIDFARMSHSELPEVCVDGLLTELQHFCGTPNPSDDFTVIVLRKQIG